MTAISAVKKAIDKATDNPDFMLALYRGQKAIKIDMEKEGIKRNSVYENARLYGFSAHIEEGIAYLYISI